MSTSPLVDSTVGASLSYQRNKNLRKQRAVSITPFTVYRSQSIGTYLVYVRVGCPARGKNKQSLVAGEQDKCLSGESCVVYHGNLYTPVQYTYSLSTVCFGRRSHMKDTQPLPLRASIYLVLYLLVLLKLYTRYLIMPGCQQGQVEGQVARATVHTEKPTLNRHHWGTARRWHLLAMHYILRKFLVTILPDLFLRFAETHR